MIAAYKGRSEVVKHLVRKGADVSLKDDNGNNTLHLACVTGNVETVKCVLSPKVVDINSRGEGSVTPVMEAARWRHREVVEFLVSEGADVSLVDVAGNNILHWACRGGDVETVEFVLSLNKVDMNAKNRSGRTAAGEARAYGHQRVVELLVSRGAQ
ncbi:histone-lysine N-methyltransferase EHMT2-like [Haliotis rufescens]|uniref:histone-lysine N-methyltransferase EHMT2-like n=1 Tax=Haliotis rufescens TaxID=6454 RepID=UPI00201EB5C7|nr:histone-lysine N-methyltransferase EHMT2-like [Haliotis rufescens]